MGEMTANERKKALGTNLDFRNAPPHVTKGIIAAREVEWQKWKKFGAAVIIKGEQLKELISKGHGVCPTQWIDTDKNRHLQHQAGYEPAYKSRLVACGQFDSCPDLRTDSPTCPRRGNQHLDLLGGMSWVSIEIRRHCQCLLQCFEHRQGDSLESPRYGNSWRAICRRLGTVVH